MKLIYCITMLLLSLNLKADTNLVEIASQLTNKREFNIVLKSDEKCEGEESFNLTSLVGSLFSFRHFYFEDCEYSLHPNHGFNYHTLDINTGIEVKLQELFNENDIVKALSSNKVVIDITNGEQFKTLSELESIWEKNSDFESCLDFKATDLSNFSFHHVKDDQVAVRIHLTSLLHVCGAPEVQIGIYLPIPTSLKVNLLQADKDKVLQKWLK